MANSDKRARLTTKGGYSVPTNGPGNPLNRTNRGIIFPYTPNITTQQQVEYNQYDLVHTNHQQYSFSKSRAPSIQVAAQFINQTEDETLYTAACIHFLRVVTKMDFGDDATAGTPPPVLQFSAYGSLNFDKVPVLVSGFTLSYPDDMDYVEAEANGVGTVQLPAIMTIAIDLIPQYSAQKAKRFNVTDFSNGSLYKGGYL